MTGIRQTNPVREQMLGTPAAVLQQFDALESQTRKLLSTPEIFATRRIILTGCGDSQMAAASVEMAFEIFAGVPVEALPAMTASRYAIPALGNQANGTLVIGISSSGAVARTVEAVRSARIREPRPSRLPAKPESPVGQAAERVLQMQSASLPSAPGFFGYMLSMVALHLLAIRMAEVKGPTNARIRRMRRECS
ncbi:MAG: SIS domain-containing protein [Chloroflexi bacterium]|nr:SIS domain-containing protein [Chloroflexota bacterium]